jgi:hypothetical protein
MEPQRRGDAEKTIHHKGTKTPRGKGEFLDRINRIDGIGRPARRNGSEG